MKSFDLKIVTLDGISYDGTAESVVARTTVGDTCILANHTDYIAPIEIGRVKIKSKDIVREGACSGGFISVSQGNVRIVATTFEFADEIDYKRAMKAKDNAEEKIRKVTSEKEQKMAEIKLKKALLRLEVSSSHKN